MGHRAKLALQGDNEPTQDVHVNGDANVKIVGGRHADNHRYAEIAWIQRGRAQ